MIFFVQQQTITLTDAEKQILVKGELRPIEQLISARSFVQADLVVITRAVVQHGFVSLLHKLIEDGVAQMGAIGLFFNLKVDLAFPVFKNLLSLAAKHARANVASYLIKKEVDLKWNNCQAMSDAISADCVEIAQALFYKKGYNLHQLDDAIRELVIAKKCPNITTWLILEGYGDALFEVCVNQNDIPRVQYFLEMGISPHLTNALAIAIHNRQNLLVDLLINSPGLIDNQFAHNALYRAVEARNEVWVDKLLDLGVNPNKNYSPSIAQYIKNHRLEEFKRILDVRKSENKKTDAHLRP